MLDGVRLGTEVRTDFVDILPGQLEWEFLNAFVLMKSHFFRDVEVLSNSPWTRSIASVAAFTAGVRRIGYEYQT